TGLAGLSSRRHALMSSETHSMPGLGALAQNPVYRLTGSEESFERALLAYAGRGLAAPGYAGAGAKVRARQADAHRLADHGHCAAGGGQRHADSRLEALPRFVGGGSRYAGKHSLDLDSCRARLRGS